VLEFSEGTIATNLTIKCFSITITRLTLAELLLQFLETPVESFTHLCKLSSLVWSHIIGIVFELLAALLGLTHDCLKAVRMFRLLPVLVFHRVEVAGNLTNELPFFLYGG